MPNEKPDKKKIKLELILDTDGNTTKLNGLSVSEAVSMNTLYVRKKHGRKFASGADLVDMDGELYQKVEDIARTDKDSTLQLRYLTYIPKK